MSGQWGMAGMTCMTWERWWAVKSSFFHSRWSKRYRWSNDVSLALAAKGTSTDQRQRREGSTLRHDLKDREHVESALTTTWYAKACTQFRIGVLTEAGRAEVVVEADGALVAGPREVQRRTLIAAEACHTNPQARVQSSDRKSESFLNEGNGYTPPRVVRAKVVSRCVLVSDETYLDACR